MAIPYTGPLEQRSKCAPRKRCRYEIPLHHVMKLKPGENGLQLNTVNLLGPESKYDVRNYSDDSENDDGHVNINVNANTDADREQLELENKSQVLFN